MRFSLKALWPIAFALLTAGVSNAVVDINNLAINATRRAGSATFSQAPYRFMVLDIDYVNAGGGAATFINASCQTCNDLDTCAAAANRTVEVITGTSAAGVSTTVPSSLTHSVGAVSASWSWIIPITSKFQVCSFTGTAANANDKVTITRSYLY